MIWGKIKKNEPGNPGLIFRNEHESLTVNYFAPWPHAVTRGTEKTSIRIKNNLEILFMAD